MAPSKPFLKCKNMLFLQYNECVPVFGKLKGKRNELKKFRTHIINSVHEFNNKYNTNIPDLSFLSSIAIFSDSHKVPEFFQFDLLKYSMVLKP